MTTISLVINVIKRWTFARGYSQKVFETLVYQHKIVEANIGL